MADIGPGKLFSCFYDICQEGPQFCHLVDKRCRYCSDYAVDCLTNLQQRNCTRYCMEQWIETRHDLCNKTGDYPAAAMVCNVVLGCLVLVGFIYIIDNECFKGKVKHKIKKAFHCIRCHCNYRPTERRNDESHQFNTTSIEDQDFERQDGEGMEGQWEPTQPLNPGRGFGNDALGSGDRSGQNDNQYNHIEGVIQASVYQNDTDVNNISSLESIGNPTNRDWVGRTVGRYGTNRSRDSRQRSEMPGGQQGGENMDRRSARGTDRRVRPGYNAPPISGGEHPQGYSCAGEDIVAGELSNTSRSPGPSAMPYHPNQRDTGYGSASSNSDLSQTCRKVSRNHGQGIRHAEDHNASPHINHMHSNGTIPANHTSTMPRGQTSGTNGMDSYMGHTGSKVESLSLDSLNRDSVPLADSKI